MFVVFGKGREGKGRKEKGREGGEEGEGRGREEGGRKEGGEMDGKEGRGVFWGRIERGTRGAGKEDSFSSHFFGADEVHD